MPKPPNYEVNIMDFVSATVGFFLGVLLSGVAFLIGMQVHNTRKAKEEQLAKEAQMPWCDAPEHERSRRLLLRDEIAERIYLALAGETGRHFCMGIEKSVTHIQFMVVVYFHGLFVGDSTCYEGIQKIVIKTTWGSSKVRIGINAAPCDSQPIWATSPNDENVTFLIDQLVHDLRSWQVNARRPQFLTYSYMGSFCH